MERAQTNAVECQRLGALVVGTDLPVQQLVAQRAGVGAAGISGVISGAGGGRPGMEILRRGKILPEKCRADGLLILPRVAAVFLDQRSIRLVREDRLCDTPDDQRID